MRLILIMAAVALCILAADSIDENIKPHSHFAHVKKVIDGDTISISDSSGSNISVRIIGIDCPETRRNNKCARDAKKGRKDCAAQIPLGKVAAETAKELLQDRDIILHCDSACMKDRYGRRLHYIQLPGNIDFGLTMVAKGLCEENSADYPHPRQVDYQRAQEKAKKSKLGIWK